MEIGKLLEKLTYFCPRTISKSKAQTHIQTCKMIVPGQFQFSPHCVYVGFASDLPDHFLKSEVVNLVCIDDKEISADADNTADINLFLLPSGTRRIEVLQRIEIILFEEAVIAAGMKRIIDSLYYDENIHSLVEVASEVFENPVFINDPAYKILAMSQKTSFKDPTLEEEKLLGYIHESNVSALKRLKLFEQVHRTNEVLLFQHPETGDNWLFKSVKIHGIVVADIGIESVNRSFRDLDYEVLEFFSRIVAIEMEKSDFFKENKGLMFNYFLEDLLSGKYKDPKAILQRTRFLDWKINSWFKVAVIEDYKSNSHENKIHHLGTQMLQLFPDCRWTVHKNNFVALISRSDKGILSTIEREKFNGFLQDNDLVAGISEPFSSLLETASHYKQAYRAVEVGKLVFRTAGSYNYTDIMIFFIANTMAEQDDLFEFSHPAVVTLQKYDEVNGTDFLETLEAYLRYPSNPSAAIASLHIHRNTLFYRINRIKEITDTDIDDGNERLKLQLYLKFVEYQKNVHFSQHS